LKTIHSQLSAALNYAVKHYGLANNPCHIAGSIGKQKAGKMMFWTVSQYEQFCKYQDKPAMKVAFDTLFYTGMRSGELLALTADDILPDLRININKNYAVVDGVEMILTPKNESSIRQVAISQFLYDEITEYISNLSDYRSDERIFYFTVRALEKDIHRVGDKAGLPRIRVHDLRHSHASMLINMKVDIKEISERLGHESVKTTWDTYSHLYPDSDKDLADRLNEIRNPSDCKKNDDSEDADGTILS
jgi:integrase